MDQPTGNDSLRGRMTALEHDIVNLQTILHSAKQSLEDSRAKYLELEKKLDALKIERNQVLIKVDCQQNTISDMKRDIYQYNTECQKLKLRLKHLESTMGEMISPVILESIAKKVESVKIPVVLEDSLPMELQKNMGLELDSSASSSARTDTSLSSKPSTSRTSD